MGGRPLELPAGLSEADVLEWIEADSRARATAALGSTLDRVSTALATNARLRALADAMRVDRAALGSLDTPAPPSWVAQAVLEEHERQALLSLSDMAALGRRASDFPLNDDGFSLSALPRWFKPSLAVAAVLALAFGAWQLIPIVLPKPNPIHPQGPLPHAELALNRPDPAQPIEATGVTPDTAEQPRVIATAPRAPLLAPRLLQPSATEILASRLDMPVEEALERVLDGRLLIVVTVTETTPARESALAVAAQPVAASWRLHDAHGELIAALALPHHARLAGLDGIGDGPISATGRGPLGQLEVVLAASPTVFTAHASASPEALLGLLDGLAQLGTGVRLLPLDEPLPGTGAMPAPAIESSLLWWQGDPAAWHPWAAIAVRFVESR